MKEPNAILYVKKQVDIGSDRIFVSVGFPLQKLYTDKIDDTVGKILYGFFQVKIALTMLRSTKSNNQSLLFAHLRWLFKKIDSRKTPMEQIAAPLHALKKA